MQLLRSYYDTSAGYELALTSRITYLEEIARLSLSETFNCISQYLAVGLSPFGELLPRNAAARRQPGCANADISASSSSPVRLRSPMRQ